MINFNARIFQGFMYPFEKVALRMRRKELISKVEGKTLEVGAGTGVNFKFYDLKKIKSLTVVDLKFNKYIKREELNKKIEIDYIEGDIEKLPFEDDEFDSIVATLILCAVDSQRKALDELKRVLKPNGKLYFIEHVVPDEKGYKRVANSCNHMWHSIGKCNINRETHKVIKNCGFKIIELESFGWSCFIFKSGIGINKK